MVRFRFRRSAVASGRPAGPLSKLGISVFFFFFFAIGSLFAVLTLRDFGRALGQRSWKKIPCVIVHSEIQERTGEENPYRFAVRYEYTHAGRKCEGSAYKRGYSGSENYSDVQSLVQRFAAGGKVSCYVNPKNPAQAVLKRDSLLIGLTFFFPLIFVAIGAGGIYFTWRKAPPPEARPIATTAIRNGRRGKYALVGFFAIFGIAGLAMLYPLGIRPIAKTLDARSWVETPCKVLHSEVRSYDGDDGTTYSIHILYAYEHEGRTYKSDRYDFIGGSSSGYRGKARIVAQYEAMPHPVCYVNPKRPSEAVLKRGFHAKLLLVLFPLPFVLVGLGGVYYALRSRKANGPKAWMPERKSKSAVAGDLSVLRRPDIGPVVLKPRHSPLVKFFGAIFIALFWNGIVSVFLVQVIGGFRQGDPSWGLTLFMVPFVVIGVGLLGLVVYQFLAMFNPRPTLELSSASIPLGGAAELGWRLSGRTRRVKEFVVTLRGTEEATYRRGTDTRTDRNTFYEMELYKTSNATEIAAGRVGVVLPQETMHSFEADNNKIVWNLDVRGDIRRWPDVKESFKITVVPAAV